MPVLDQNTRSPATSLQFSMDDAERRDTIDAKSVGYLQMAKKWPLVETLLGGTQAMRDAAEQFLPREPKEQAEQYECRRQRSFLFNGYRDTIRKLVSRPFSEPVQIENVDQLPEALQPLEDNVDREGTDLTQFARACFHTGLVYGLGHILVDFPPVPEGATRAEELELGGRPFFVLIPPPDLWGWQTSEAQGGASVLEQIRIHETVVEPAGEYADDQVEYIRVFNRQTWSLWRKRRGEREYVPVATPTNRVSLGRIPLVTYYFAKTGNLTGEPPLEDLAWLNVAHWQSESDQRNVLRFARMGILAATGVSKEERKSMGTVGPRNFLWSENPQAKFYFAEHSGAAIGAGREDLDRLERRMEQHGQAPMLDRASHSTATGVEANESRSHSDMKAWTRALNGALYSALRLAGEMIGQEVPEEVRPKIFSDFSLFSQKREDLEILTKVWQGGGLPDRQFILEMQRRGVISDSSTPEDLLEELAQQLPRLPALGEDDQADDDDDQEPDGEEEEENEDAA